MITVGTKLRELRKKRKISLLELSRTIGMGYSFLSGLENDKYSITIANLQKLADFFGVNLIYFLQSDEENCIKLTRAEDAEKYEMEGGMIFQVLTPSDTKNVQTSKVFLPMNTPKKPEMHNHSEGEEILIVLNGVLNVKVGDKEFELYKGDTLYFNSSYEHCIYTKKNSAEFILITSPPMGIKE